jgi:hypothetical protein
MSCDYFDCRQCDRYSHTDDAGGGDYHNCRSPERSGCNVVTGQTYFVYEDVETIKKKGAPWLCKPLTPRRSWFQRKMDGAT